MTLETADNTIDKNLPKVLLVDDKPQNLYVLERILGGLDCATIEALSGEAALSMIIRHEFIAIIMDVNMPGMDGIETAELIRENKASADIPILFLTAASKEELETKYKFEFDNAELLTKPIDVSCLLTKVQKVLDTYH